MNIARALCAAWVIATSVGSPAAQAQTVDAPNFIRVAPLLATSGQPSAEALGTLGAQGIQAVVYLAPSNVSSAVKEEPELLARQGVEFVHIPVPFGSPDDAQVQAVFAALKRLEGRSVLVHCEINMRASTLVFLYRTIQQQQDPSLAYEAVARVWSPRGVWRRLVVDELAKNHIAFEPY